MKHCEKCHALANDAQQFCTQDGGTLETDILASDLQKTLGDKYTLTHLIGQGSMGAVYRARHRDLDDVAIKVMLGQKNNAQLSARFLREAQALRRLRHPNSVLVYDLERSPSGVSYMVMEMVEGTSLRQELDRRHSLPVEEAVVIAEAVCEALQEAHEYGIIHRDIKPDNILIAEDILPSGRTQRRIKLVDFGVVKLPATGDDDSGRPITRAGTPIGSPFYMSPEQWFGEGPGLYGLDGRADLYGLGCTIYEMLAGRVPFTARTTKEMRQLHLSMTPKPLYEVAPQVPLPVSDVVMRALAKDRDERYITATAFATALRAAYEESFRATAQLSAVRLAAAKEAWGRSDAPPNEQQLAPTFDPHDKAAQPAQSAAALREAAAAQAEAEPVAANVKLLPPAASDAAGHLFAPTEKESDVRPFLPTDSGADDDADEVTHDARPVMVVPSGLPDAAQSGDEAGPEAAAWAKTADPDPPALGDTFLGRAQKTGRLEELQTKQLRNYDATTPPRTPSLVVRAENIVPPAVAVPPSEVSPVAAPPAEVPPLAETSRALKPSAPAGIEEQTHQIIWPESVARDNALPSPVLPPHIVPVPAPVPAPPVPVPKSLIAGGIALLVVIGVGLAYRFWPPPPPPPNIEQTNGPKSSVVNVPGLSALRVKAPAGSVIFVNDERKTTADEDGVALVQVAEGTHNLRVVSLRPPNVPPFIQDVNVKANETNEVTATFGRPAEPGPAAGAEARRQRAEALMRQQNYPAAEAEYRQFIAEAPENMKAHAGLAQILAVQKRYAEALAEQETVVRIYTKDRVALNQLAQLYALKRRNEDAEIALRRGLRESPRDLALQVTLTRLLTRQPERLDEALRAADAALENRANSPDALDAKACVLIERALPDGAADYAQRAVQRAPRELAWQVTWAVALWNAGRTDLAAEKYRQVLQSDKRNEWRDAATLGRQRIFGATYLATLAKLMANS